MKRYEIMAVYVKGSRILNEETTLNTNQENFLR